MVATMAAEAASDGVHPVRAWTNAANLIFPHSPSSVKKSCPRSTFLGLAEAGQIRGIGPGKYTTSGENKGYGLQATKALRNNPDRLQNSRQLWEHIMAGTEKRHNCQMDVVLALWKGGYLVASIDEAGAMSTSARMKTA